MQFWRRASPSSSSRATVQFRGEPAPTHTRARTGIHGRRHVGVRASYLRVTCFSIPRFVSSNCESCRDAPASVPPLEARSLASHASKTHTRALISRALIRKHLVRRDAGAYICVRGFARESLQSYINVIVATDELNDSECVFMRVVYTSGLSLSLSHRRSLQQRNSFPPARSHPRAKRSHRTRHTASRSSARIGDSRRTDASAASVRSRDGGDRYLGLALRNRSPTGDRHTRRSQLKKNYYSTGRTGNRAAVADRPWLTLDSYFPYAFRVLPNV